MSNPENKNLDNNNKNPEYDDTLKPVPETKSLGLGKMAAPAFALFRLQALEKPKLEEELIEPDGGSACGCNSVCACVPVETCACNQVCTCDTVDTCLSYSSGCYGGGGGYGGYWAPCH